MYWHARAFRHVTPRPELLAIGGSVDMASSGLSLHDLAGFASEHQVRDVGAFARAVRLGGAPIQGVRLAGLFQHVRLHPEAILVNVLSRNGFQATLWTNEILPLAIVAYARDGDVLPRELGGPYRLIVPGLHDEAGDVWDLAVIEASVKPAKRPRNRRGLVPPHSSRPGEVQGGLPRAVPDPLDPRGLVAPEP